jgi:ribonuclease P protein component
VHEDASACPPDAPLNPRPAPFPKSARLNRPPEFDRVFRTATVRRSQGALRLSAVANRMPAARLGLVVSKRALPGAVQRNRARRVLRETFRQQRATLPSMDIVVQVTGDASNRAYRETFEALLAELPTS